MHSKRGAPPPMNDIIKVITVITGALGLLAAPARAIAFDEVSSLHIWLTVSSLVNRDPANSKQLLFRQIELNWINAPLDDPDDFLGLYLDGPPESARAQLVAVHPLNGRMSGKLATEHQLPLIDFMNETRHLRGASARQAPNDGDSNDGDDGDELERETLQYDVEGPGGEPGASGLNKWHQYNRYGPSRRRRRKSLASQATLVDECVGYCLAYHSLGRVLATNCLRTNPNWMRDTQATSRALPSLMLPGTHNSATYPRQLDRTALQIINKYQINQEESVFSQLLYGIRYLDLRVGYCKVRQRPEELWIYHDIFRTDVSLEEVFEQVGRFLELTTHEIVVMDFHRFTVGFQNENARVQRERHAKLIELLFNRLGQHIIPSYLGQHAPLNEYIAMGRRLIVGYANRAQLLGAAAAAADQQHHASSMFGLYSAAAAGSGGKRKNEQQQRQQRERASELDEREAVATGSNSSYLLAGAAGEAPQLDRRVGTRIYDKLKSFKLISRQFSKRAAEHKEDAQRPPQTVALTPAHKQLVPNGARLRGQTTTQTTSQTTTTTSRPDKPAQLNKMAQLVQASEGAPAGSLEEALASLNSRLALLFAPVRHLWPNKDTLEGLAQYMNETTCRKYFGELRSMMVELTPTVFGAISDKYDGNRRLADLANRPVTDWIRQRWLHCLNIVASDFFLGNDLIRLSIYANKMRLSNSHRHGQVDDLSSPGGGQQCASFRRVGHLLDKSRPATAASAAAGGHQQLQPAAPTNPDGISDLFSFFKRVFNL